MNLSFPEHHLLQILQRYENQHLPLDLFLRHYFRSNKALGSKDRHLISEAVFGMTRWRFLLDHLVGQKPSWEKRYRIYREFQPMNYLYVNSIPLHTRVSFPQDLFKLLVESHGEQKAIALCQTCNTEAPITVRINPLKTTREELFKRWTDTFECTYCENSPLGLQMRKRYPLLATPEYKEGFFEIQDEASQQVSFMVDVKPGEQVLDYCAGAGGKTLGFAHKTENKGQIYLHDIRTAILNKAKQRLARAGVQNAQFLTPEHPKLPQLKKKMDWVLVDVPCSGTGTLRRNPDQKLKFKCAELEELISQQRVIFERALSYVKPGGKIVYATCSILRQENEMQSAHFLEHYPIEAVGDPFYTLPTLNGHDGFFAIVFEKQDGGATEKEAQAS